MTSARHLTARLLRALDDEYNVVDMHAIDEVISVLENINITKELLETTRLGKHVNELRRRTDDVALARRAKLLLKRWRDLIIPDKGGSNASIQTHSGDNTPRQSPYPGGGISPAVTPSVTPRLCSPQVAQGLSIAQKQGSLTPSKDLVKSLHSQKRQPLTSPALHNLSPSLKISSHLSRNSSPNFKNVSSGQKTAPSAFKSVSPAVKNMSPSLKNTSSGVRNLSPAVNIISPALRIHSETVWNVTPSKDPYDSDSNDVIFVDDNVDDRTTYGNNTSSTHSFEQNDKYSKKPRSPVNGGPDPPLPGEELRRGDKRERRETSSRKAKKRRNHTKSENLTVDHSADIISVESPFLPISSASTSPALSTSGSMRNGLTNATLTSVPMVIDDLDSKSPIPTSDSKSKSSSSSSRKNGCKKSSVEVDDYSNFIKNKIPTGGRKVKTTKELLEEMEARKSGKIPNATISEKKSKPKKDFLATYDSQRQMKKEPIIVTDIIELNDSNSGSKIIESGSQGDKDDDKSKGVSELKQEDGDKPVKFEPVDVILSRLPPLQPNWSDPDDFFAPVCTCTMLYDIPDEEMKIEEPVLAPKRSIFEMDEEEKVKDKDESSFPISNFKESIDPDCYASTIYEKKPAEIANNQIDALHNSYLVDVNGSKCDSSIQRETKLACKMDPWGLRPYYDCSRDLFHNVVPKYNYLDYSLDKCVKNLKNIILDKYEPAESVVDGSEWFINLENEHFEQMRVKNESSACDDYQSAADSPFSEKADGDRSTPDLADTHLDSDIKNSVSDKNNTKLDRDGDVSTHLSAINEEKKTSDEKKSRNDSEKPIKNSNCFEILDYEVETQCQPFSTLYSKCIFLDDVDFADKLDDTGQISNESVKIDDTPVTPMDESNPSAEKIDFVIKPSKIFTYEDEITLLPLSLPALNAPIAYNANGEVLADLSCVFRTKVDDEPLQNCDDLFSSKESSELTYNLVNNVEILEMKEITKSVISRTRDLFVGAHDEDANFGGSDVQSLNLTNKLSNSGALENESEDNVEKCVGNGCPTWIPGSVPPNGFREWHEPVVRTSYNEEPLTILPYVVID